MNRNYITPGNPRDGYMDAVQGIIDEKTYQALIKKGVHGRPVPIDFHGYKTTRTTGHSGALNRTPM
ncbi:hypothetical protein DPMN_160334 [Dreissena polymorpha]|uniref:Uncharacterized protein n=1 Tax=Dreissena polymorpha TaxID=45954 RepID=A0A9D4IRJ2_DREPO|nr:hypothetical protein DPMN_160334 [Dreissena polymorpha]